jgi:hypothetical protein
MDGDGVTTAGRGLFAQYVTRNDWPHRQWQRWRHRTPGTLALAVDLAHIDNLRTTKAITACCT